MTDDFVNIHVHSYFSLLDGLNSPYELVSTAKDLDQSAITITDHGSISAHRDIQKACDQIDIKPILGCELYYSADRFDRTPVAKRDDNTALYSHVIALAKNQNGLKNLNKIVEDSWKSFYYKPLVDMELLYEFGDDLIITSACMGGAVSKLILSNNEDAARELLLRFKYRWNDDFYIEVQSHNPTELNLRLLQFAKELGIKPVAATDAHYASEKDRAIEEALLILSTKPKLGKESSYQESLEYEDIMDRFNYLYPDRKMSFDGIDLFLQSRQQMTDAFLKIGIDRQDLFDNTLEIADKIDKYDYLKDQDLLPRPIGIDPNTKLKELCMQGLKNRNIQSTVYTDRINSELDIIIKKNFSTYFLIVRDIVHWSKNSNILVGPGRGSAAGSLVCYSLGITNIDPIEYNLLFDRFINASRNDYPDIDLDFEDSRRGEVKEYIRKRFGNDNVASISTYAYFKDKGVFRDAARVFNVPLNDVNSFLKGVTTFDECMYSRDGADFRKKYPEVISLANKLRGKIRGAGIHASGVVVSNKPISDYAPIETRVDPSDKVSGRVPVIAYDMNQAADVGLIKIDILGLKTLSVISETLSTIKQRRGITIDLDDIPLDDIKVLNDLSNGFTSGVFQCEAPPYTSLLEKMGLSEFNDLVASNALVRPGAMNVVGEEYVSRKKSLSPVKSIHPIYDEITKDTYGCVLYQEQIMLIGNKLAGMSWSDCDRLRKIIGKKMDVHEFDQFKEMFLDGAEKHIDRNVAEVMWSGFEESANYMFNKSHAVAYSTLSYWCAYLKHYYSVEFIYAILKNEHDVMTRTEYLIEAKRLGIKIMMPHINHSDANIKIDGNGIRFGLNDIKYISDKVSSRIIHRRPYNSYAELLTVANEKYSGINSRAIGSMNKIGAASFDDNPKRGDESNYYYEYLGIPDFSMNVQSGWKSQISKLIDFEPKGIFIFYAMVQSIKIGTGWSRNDLIDSSGTAGIFYKENTNIEVGKLYLFLVSNNRIEKYIEASQIENMQDDPLIRFLNAEELNLADDKKAVVNFSSRKTKAGKWMGNVILSNKDKELRSAVVFNKQYAKALDKLIPGRSVNVKLASMKDETVFVKDIF